MYYVYLLYSNSNKEFYIGSTPDLKKRYYSHNARRNIATRDGAPWRLVYYEAYPTKDNALSREYKLKYYGQGLRRLKERISLVDSQ